jgi:NAD(P)H-dependent FMN reductase
MAKILVFAGSSRKDSLNKKLAQAAAQMVQRLGVETTFVDLADYPMPLYDGDVEEAQGLPQSMLKLYPLFKAADGLLIACPEYNSSITPLLKNTIDWLSRPQEGEPRLGAFAGKVVGVMGTSPGALGAMRVLRHVREIMGNIGCLVIPQQVGVPNGSQVFGPDGNIIDEATNIRLEEMVKAMVKTTRSIA